MRRRSRWVLPALTALCVAAAALVPPGLSRLEDRRTETAVHSEDLTGDNNFSVWRPAMGERVGEEETVSSQHKKGLSPQMG